MMYILLAVLLGAGLPTAAQQQISAGAMYRVSYTARATGSFTTVIPLGLQDFTINFTSDESPVATGSAFAVDPDGWLLTAGHVVDLQGLTGDYCQNVASRFARFRVDRITMDMVVTDIVGNITAAQYVVTPPAGSHDDVCHTRGARTIMRDKIWPVRIVATDTAADLGLIKLDRRDGPVAVLEVGSVSQLQPLEWVYSFGYPDRILTMRQGFVKKRCESHVDGGRTEYLTRYIMDAIPGMSGGPVILGDQVMGVIVKAGPVLADSSNPMHPVEWVTLAVPSDYAYQWYAYARGFANLKPVYGCTP